MLTEQQLKLFTTQNYSSKSFATQNWSSNLENEECIACQLVSVSLHLVLSLGSGVVTTRAHVHYIVTEYGIAYLFGKSLRQRAYALINIAHPDHREWLEKEAFNRLQCMPSPWGNISQYFRLKLQFYVIIRGTNLCWILRLVNSWRYLV